MATGTTAEQIIDVVTPAAGESVTEGTILEWHVKVGDAVKADATIVEISTDKVDVELPSPATGVVTELLVEEGDTVTVGQVIARIAVGASPGTAADASGGNGAGATKNGAGNGAAHSEQETPAEDVPADGTAAPADAGQATADGAEAPPTSAGAAGGQLGGVVPPAAGESVSEGTILEWRAKVGDFIKQSDTIVEISTDKVDVELPAPVSGTIAELLARGGARA